MNLQTTTALRQTSGCLELHADAAEFCERHNLLELVELAAKIASRHFSLSGPLEAELLVDPDADEEMVLLTAPVSTSVELTRKHHEEYLAEWSKCAPADKALRIILSPNIVGNSNEPS